MVNGEGEGGERFFWQNGSVRARESLLLSRTQKVLRVTGGCFFPFAEQLESHEQNLQKPWKSKYYRI